MDGIVIQEPPVPPMVIKLEVTLFITITALAPASCANWTFSKRAISAIDQGNLTTDAATID